MPIHIGTSGWSYKHWKGILYPPKATSVEQLDFYTHRFHTVEVNNTFYRWPADKTFDAWRKRVPDGFLMSVKAASGLTHFRRLSEPEDWIQRMAIAVQHLRQKFGVLLVQLPPRFGYSHARLERFLSLVPKWMRVACEFRHESWHREGVFDLLARHGAAYCITSGPGHATIVRVTAPYVYVRFHSPTEPTEQPGSYSDEELRPWAEQFLAWDQAGKEVFAYFNNDVHGHAVRNAETLIAMTAAQAAVGQGAG